MTLDKDGFIDTLEPNEVFVFGSNTAGRHGKGAALTALRKFGAVYGVGEGLRGQSYAFPTLNQHFRKVGFTDLARSRRRLYDTCIENLDKIFYMTKVGCGLAGFPEQDMKDIFQAHPGNLVLPEDWR